MKFLKFGSPTIYHFVDYRIKNTIEKILKNIEK